MKQCPHCNSEILDDSLFCDRCGQHLMICADCGTFVRGKFCRICGGRNIIDALEYEQQHGRPQVSLTGELLSSPHEESLSKDSASEKGNRIAELRSDDGSISLMLEDSEEFIIGRKSPQFATDLACCAKMSRKHAMICWNEEDGEWQVTDLDSAHGTRINGKSIATETPYAIRNGDTITFAGYEFSFTETGGSSSSSSSDSQGGSSVRVDNTAEIYVKKAIEYDDMDDYENSYRYYKKAAELGNANAMGGLGHALIIGLGVEQDERKGMKWIKKGASLNDDYSQFLLGFCYLNGEGGVDTNYDEAMTWLRKASENGNTMAMVSIGEIYNNGYGVKENPDEAIRWLKKALKEGETEAYFQLGVAYDFKEDYQEALRWYKKGADDGNELCMRNIGYLYDDGGLPTNYQEALRWYKKGANEGNYDCMRSIGLLYYDNGGLPVDYQETIKWYRKAIEAGDDEALYLLAQMYYYGDGVDEDEDKCFELMHEAADKGNENAIKWLEENE